MVCGSFPILSPYCWAQNGEQRSVTWSVGFVGFVGFVRTESGRRTEGRPLRPTSSESRIILITQIPWIFMSSLQNQFFNFSPASRSSRFLPYFEPLLLGSKWRATVSHIRRRGISVCRPMSADYKLLWLS